MEREENKNVGFACSAEYPEASRHSWVLELWVLCSGPAAVKSCVLSTEEVFYNENNQPLE